MTLKERIERQRKLEELVNRYEKATSSWAKESIADMIVAELKKKIRGIYNMTVKELIESLQLEYFDKNAKVDVLDEATMERRKLTNIETTADKKKVILIYGSEDI